MRWWVLLVAATATLSPTVPAMPVEGRLDVQALALDAPAVGQFDLHAFYANDTSRVTRFELVAQAVEVRVWRASDAHAGLPVGPLDGVFYRYGKSEDTKLYTHARITLDAGDHEGWMGARWAPDAEATLAPGAEVAFRLESAIGYTQNPAQDSDARAPDVSYFLEPLDAPHLLVDGAQGLRLEGEGVVRLMGIDLDVDAREGHERLATGIVRTDAPAGTAQSTWVMLTFMNGTLDAAGLDGTQAQALAATLAWDGGARLREPAGALEGARSTWLPDGDADTLTGAFEAHLAPGGDGIRVDLVGDLQGATMTTQAHAPAPVAAVRGALPWLLLGALAVAGGAYGYAKRRAPPATRDATVEDLLDLALQAAEANDHERALVWIRRARRQAPGSERLALEEAAILEASGDDEAAVRAYRDLASRSANGEACWLLARVLARRGAHPDDVAPWLVRALEADALLLFEVQEDEALATIVRRADVRAAMQAARAKLQ